MGYARVSTADQHLCMQEDALKSAGCSDIYHDGVSGAKVKRPGLDEVFNHLRSGDMLVVWKLDRLGRSLSHLIEMVKELESRKIGFQSLQENIDTTTTGGKLVFHIFSTQYGKQLIKAT